MKKITQQTNDQWIRDNFEQLITQHAGEYVAVVKGKAFFGKTRKEAEQKAEKHAQNIIPSVMQVPHEESLVCAL